MKAILFGATGMVGQGVLRECFIDASVTEVLSVGRSPTGVRHAKLREVLHDDFTDFSKIESQLAGYDACFFCLGVSSIGMDPERYRHLTYDVTMAAAKTLARLNPGMVFTYVSGGGTDGTERGRIMWARVKGRTENDLAKLPFAGVYLFRPGIIQPLHGIKTKTPSYRIFYILAKPLLPVARALFPNLVLTTEEMGRAMLNAARLGPGRRVLEASDIARLARDPR